MSKAILDTAEVIHDYMRNGDRSTSREECITWIAQLIQEASKQAPSATVDEKIGLIFSRHSVLNVDRKEFVMNVPMFMDALAELHSQQPTVDVDALFTKYAVFIHDRDGIPKKNVSALIQEALRGSYTRTDMIKFGMDMYGSGVIHGKGFETVDEQDEYFNRMIKQYDTERGMNNGKV